MSEYSEEKKDREPRSPAEWVSFAISLAILASIVSLVLYRWATTDDQPPVLAITTDSKIRQVKSQFYVPFTITNAGGETAESVEISAQLIVEGRVAEEGSQTIDFLSGGEVESGAFIFSRDPRAGQLVVRVTSYKLP